MEEVVGGQRQLNAGSCTTRSANVVTAAEDTQHPDGGNSVTGTRGQLNFTLRYNFENSALQVLFCLLLQ